MRLQHAGVQQRLERAFGPDNGQFVVDAGGGECLLRSTRPQRHARAPVGCRSRPNAILAEAKGNAAKRNADRTQSRSSPAPNELDRVRRRANIPKADGRQRPLGIAALENRVVQRAVVEVMNAIYEEDCLGFSYGFRPKRGQHNALDALATGITRKKVNWVLDADIRGYFDNIDHEWLVKFVEHRIGDGRLLRLIQKWLKAGVMEDGKWAETAGRCPRTPRSRLPTPHRGGAGGRRARRRR